MPYYVYKITPGSAPAAKTLELLEVFDVYRDARKMVRSLRAGAPPGTNLTYRMVFSESPTTAERQLLEHREAPILKEWEK
jgi:hypothetical protein